MSVIHLPVAYHVVDLDICCRCQQLWFDPSELEALPPPTKTVKEELPQKAREALALHAIENIKITPPTPESVWSLLAGFLGFPVEANAPLLTSRPWCTWTLALLCILTFLLTLGNMPEAWQEWGMIPAECFRHGGLTFITSMFLHGGICHLISNLYFLLVFGDNVEDALGKPVYLAVVVASGLSAHLLHILFTPNPYVPCVGASGFISGIIAAYAVFFPKVTLSLMTRYSVWFRWVNVPAWGAFGLWFALQTFMSLRDPAADTGVAYCAHLGGSLMGLAAGFLLRKQVEKYLENT